MPARKLFQLDLLLGGLGAPPAAQATPSVREIKVTDEVLNALIRQAEDWIRKDEVFVAELKKRYEAATHTDVAEVLEQACKVAASDLRQRLSNTVVSGFWPLAEAVLQAVIKGQLAVMAQGEALDLSSSPDLVLATLGTSLAKELHTMSRIKEIVYVYEEKAPYVLEQVARAFWAGTSFRDLFEELVAFTRQYMQRKSLAKGRQKVLEFCTSLLLQGRVHRFELKELEGLLLALEQDPLPRASVESGILALAKRLGNQRLKELQTPLAGGTADTEGAKTRR